MVQDEALTVVLWLWNGWRPVYDYTHVNAMVRMLRANLSIPFRIVCFTDLPDTSSFICETRPLWDIEFNVLDLDTKPGARRPPLHRLNHKPLHPRLRKPLIVQPIVQPPQPTTKPNSYRRLRMFSEWAAQEFPGTILSIDLDAVVVSDLAPILTDHDFRINKGRCSPYNGGMWMLRTGTRQQVWDQFGCHAYRTTRQRGWIGSDQAWIAHVCPNEATWDAEDGVYHYSLATRSDPLPECRVMFTAGAIKPWHEQFRKRHPVLHGIYMRALRCST
jgi:hypothetical protein